MRRSLALLAIALLTASCGDSSTETGSTSTTSTSTTTSTSIAATPSTVPGDELPGEPLDIGPMDGAVMSVFGVRHDDVLNVRSIPGLDGEVVATLDPTEQGFLTTGRHRLLPTTAWTEILIDGSVVGWVNRSFVAIEGVTTDETARIIELTGALAAPSLEELGQLLVQALADETMQRSEMSVAPTEGDLGEVTFDLVGIGDDAVVGYRLHLFALDEVGDGTWTLRTVERTSMCGRGGEPGGLCL